MPTSDKTVKVTLVAVASPYVKGTTEAAAATKKLGGDIDRTAQKTKGLEQGMGRASGALKGLAVAGAAVAGAGLVTFLTDSVRAAGDLQQSVGGVEAVFKDQADTIKRFGENSAEAVGLSTNAFNELVTVSGALLKNKGIEDFTGQALNLVKVGADLAAQFGGPTSQAVEALNAAMRGEADPIERYGISINETAVNAELAAKGLDKLEGKALDQAKAQARIQIIMEQSADAAGAFAREADTLQGQQQRLTAEWENARAELGTALLPALTDVTQALRAGVDVAVAAGEAWGKIPGPVKAAIAALILYRLTNQRVASGLSAAADGVRRMREELALQRALAGGISGGYQRLGDEAGKAAGNVSRAAGAIGVASKAARGIGGALMGAFGGPVGLAIVGLTTVITAFASAQADSKQNVEELSQSLDEQTGKVTENTRAIVAKRLADEGLLDIASRLGIEQGVLTDALLGSKAAQDEVNASIDEAIRLGDEYAGTTTDTLGIYEANRKGANDLRGALGDLGGELDSAQDDWKQLNGEIGNGKVAQAEVEQVTDDTTAAIEEQEKAVRDLAKQVLELSDAHMSAVDAEIAYQAALDEVNASIQENGETAKKGGKELDLTTEAGRANAQALLDQAAQAKAVAEANLQQGDSLKSLRKGMDEARDKFIENAMRMGLSKEAAKKMADEFGLTKTEVDNMAKSVEDLPASKQIKVEVEKEAAAAALKQLKADLAGLKNKTVVVTTIGRVIREEGTKAGSKSTVGGLTFASGGSVKGPGTGTSDSIPAWLSNGEYVVKAAAVAKYGTNLLDHINAMRFAEGGAVRYGSRAQVPAVASYGPAPTQQEIDQRIFIDTLVTPDQRSFRRESQQRRARAYGSNVGAS